MSQRLTKRLLLIGWDGADWQIINPLMERGELPNLRTLVESGVMGNFASMNPMISPMLWTTMATGKPPHVHGICGFVEPDAQSRAGQRLVGSTSRKCKAFWNILSQSGLKTHVVAWYANHPAEPINGVCVSERFAKAWQRIERGWPVPAGSVHPSDWAEQLSEIRIHPQEIGLEHLESLIPAARSIDQSSDQQLTSLAKNLAQCATNQAVTTWILETQPWDCLAVYFNTINMICHSFMYFHPPRMKHVPEDKFELYKDVVAGIYRFHDLMLGRLLELVDDDTTIMIVSDHGYKSGHNRPVLTPAGPAGAISWHRPYGIVVMKGPGIKHDELMFGGRIINLTPTILAMFSLPLGQDMPGRPLLQAFTHVPQIDRIASWENVAGESGMHDASLSINPVEELETMKQLEALGYIEPVSDDKQKVMQLAADEIRYNTARSFISLGRHDDAVEQLEIVVANQPRRLDAAFNLADCYQALGRNEECRDLIDRISKGQFDDHTVESRSAQLLPQLDYLYGLLELNAGLNESALSRFQTAEKRMGDQPATDFHKNLAHAYLRMELWSRARRSFEKALLIEPDDPRTLHGLAIVALQENRDADAAELSLKSLQLLFQQPRVHFHLGVACSRMGELDRAKQAFETCLAMRPDWADARQWLEKIRN